MLVIAACLGLVLLGAVAIVRWGGADPAPPGRPAGLLRYAAVAVGAGLAAGLIAAGAGGRLVMRLLALTSPGAEGSFTEAGEVVGEITAGGTLGFIVFTGIPAGILSGVLYAVVRPLLPRGRAGGLALGLLLLMLAGTRIDPLVADNIDFNLLEPAWLAVLAFSALALFQGMLVFALAARIDPRPPPVHPRGGLLTGGRVVLAILFLVALPGFLGSVGDILGV